MSKIRRQSKHDDPTVPRKGDTLMTITCDRSLPLEPRAELLTYGFAKAIQGAVLRRIVLWDLVNGVIKVIAGGGPATPGPRGKLTILIEDAPLEVVEGEVCIDVKDH